MALQSQTIDVPLISLQQSWPTTAGVAGRLISLNNAIAKRWMGGEQGARLRVEKRDGFVPFGETIRNLEGGTSTKTLGNPTMLTNRGQQLLALASASIFACGRSNLDWSVGDYVCPTEVLEETSIINRGTIDQMPDSCFAGGLTLETWNTFNGTDTIGYFSITDLDGTIVREVTEVGEGTFTPVICTKCVSDGTRLWLIVKPSGVLSAYAIFCYNTEGTLLGSDVVTIPQDGAYWDIVPNSQTANGFVFIQRDGAGANFCTRKVTLVGSVVTVSAKVASTGGCSTGRVAFLKNVASTPDHKYYAVSVDGAGPYNFFAWSIDDSTLATSSITLAAAQAVAPVEITGWADSSTSKYTIALSFLDTIPRPQRNYTEIWTISFGTPAKAATKKSLTVVSRVLTLGDSFYVVGYYQSDPSTVALANNIQQSTFYLISLDRDEVFQVCGEWAKGTAYADWQRTTLSADWFHLSSVSVRADGSSHVALNFRARSFTTRTVQASSIGDTAIFGDTPVNSVGIKDFGFGETNRRAVEFSNETLIPGARVTSWIGSPTNHGISLVPELSPPSTAVTGGAGLAHDGTYEVVAVAEWTDGNGQRVRSIAGPPFAFSTGAGPSLYAATYTGLMLHNEVNKPNMIISLYRTAFINGIQSNQHYKVTNDLVPLYNDDGAATFSFADTMTDADASRNEILYTDKGFLDRFPCPPFSSGCSDAQRAYVIGYDKAIWFSGSKAEGDATWFTPVFRILLNNDIPVSLALLDTTLVIFGENNIYVVSTSALPANDGSGSIPIPVELPLTHGCTGPVATCSVGVVFPSTQGGIWLISRALTDLFIGKDVKSFVESNGPIVDLYVDANQRVACLTAQGDFAVYDAVSNAWYTWTLPGGVFVSGVNRGEIVVGYFDGTISHQVSGVFADDAEAIITSFRAQFPLGGVRNFKRIWDMQTQGEYRDAHTLDVNGYFDDDAVTVVENYHFTPDAANLQYVYDLPPKVEECANLTLEFIDSFPLGPSAGFALEMVSFELGVQTGLDRLSPTSRRKNSTP